MNFRIHKNWSRFFSKNTKELSRILSKVMKLKIYPKKRNIFKIYRYLPPNKIKVVILGQDPYFGYEIINGKEVPQAHGLSFSVPSHHRLIPPSLRNIFAEIKASYPAFKYKNGNLKKWAKEEGVFLLNSSLTVLPGKSNSHQDYWERFTDKTIQHISDKCENVVFVLLGNYAKSKERLIDRKRNVVLTSSHPSPLGANRGFTGSKIFKKVNDELEKKKIKPVDWNLDDK